MLLDEFPSLGRLAFFEAELPYLAGYGIKCFLIAQSLNQIEKAYGPNNAILDNCHIRVTYNALDERTAKRISELLGQATLLRRQRSFSGGASWLSKVSHSEQEVGRALLMPDEILRLPYDEALLMVGGLPPYHAKKIMYYLDDRFRDRAWLKPPESARSRRAELPRARAADEVAGRARRRHGARRVRSREPASRSGSSRSGRRARRDDGGAGGLQPSHGRSGKERRRGRAARSSTGEPADAP